MTSNFSELLLIEKLLVQHHDKVSLMHKSKNYKNLGFLKFLKTCFLNKGEIPNKALKIGIWGTFFIHRRTIYFTNVNMFYDLVDTFENTVWLKAKSNPITWQNENIEYYKLPLTKNMFHRNHIMIILKYELRLYKKHTRCIYPEKTMKCAEASLLFRLQHIFPELLKNNIYAENIYKHNTYFCCSKNEKKLLTEKLSTKLFTSIHNKNQ